jgi:alpha-1,2-mannosyltransferase
LVVRANVLHVDLNPRGGAERVAIATIRALADMGAEVDLTTTARPDLNRLAGAFGADFVRPLKGLKNIHILSGEFAHNYDGNNASSSGINSYDLTINTHGDMLPFYHSAMTKENSITYCHYPIAMFATDFWPDSYVEQVKPFLMLSNKIENSTSASSSYSRSMLLELSEEEKAGKARKNRDRTILKSNYDSMIRNTKVLTNSNFSQFAIHKWFGIDASVLYPPVDTESFTFQKRRYNEQRQQQKQQSASGYDDDNSNTVLVVSRLNPTKKIENAIQLARLLKAGQVSKHVIIAGNLDPPFAGYLSYLRSMISRYELEDFIKLESNLSFERLIELMRTCKAYFHCLPGEPFGLSAAEAMSCGCIPAVPHTGGYAEFVPEKYQFSTFKEAAERVSLALNASESERAELAGSIEQFSVQNYIQAFKNIVA